MKNGLLIDTNLLLVMIIGGIDEQRHIKTSKRLGDFSKEDYFRLWEIAKKYDEIWITQYIATEVSNLIDLTDDARVRAFELMRQIIVNFKEVKTKINDDCIGSLFLSFGLTDNSIINLSKKLDILTYDHRMLVPLYEAAPENIYPYYPIKKR